MAITLPSLAASSLASSQARGRSGVDPAAQAFQKVDKRIQQQREIAAVQLSSFGKVKSAFADVRTAAALSDSKAFDAALGADSVAVRTTLSSVGQQVELAATAQLADGGNVGKSVNGLSERVRSLETRQADQQALASAARQTVSAQANRFNDSLNSGAAAYQRVFSL